MSSRVVLILAALLALLAVVLAFRGKPEALDPGGDVGYVDHLNWLSVR